MRRLKLACVLTAALGLTVAAPVAADAPGQDPNTFAGTLTCGSETFDMIAIGMVAWPQPVLAGTTPGLAFGGTLTIYVDGQVVDTVTVAPPPGLVDKLQTCRFERQAGDIYRVWEPFYVLWPSQ